MTARMRFSAAMAAFLALQPVAISQVWAKDSSPTAAGKVKAKKICHTEVPTGSIKPVRVCRTQEELDRNAQQAQDRLEDMNRMSQQQTQNLRS